MPFQASPVAQAWACPACRRENPPHHQFCLGCGAERSEGAAPRLQASGYDGAPVNARPPSAKWIVLLVAAIVVAGAIASGAWWVVVR